MSNYIGDMPAFQAVKIAATAAGHRLAAWQPVGAREASDCAPHTFKAQCANPGCELVVRASAATKISDRVAFSGCPVPSGAGLFAL
jgi:hypothetical protein